MRATSRGEGLIAPLTCRYGSLNSVVLVPLHAAGGAARKHLAVRRVGEPDVGAAAFTVADGALLADDV